MTLKHDGYEIITAASGEEALLRPTEEQPDLIIMNVGLPKMNGFEVTRRLRQNQKLNHVPIIAVTRCTMNGDKTRILEAGCDAYSPKPINTREFPTLVVRMLHPPQ